ncbi:MAG: hypothetical protein AB2L12_10965 [Smithellaceae bacterium]
MKDKNESGKILTDYYEAARKSFIARMKLEDEEQINLKIKIATFVIYELSHSTPSWFKNYFLSNISKNTNETDIIENKKILKVESAFFNAIGNYLINMESEVDYVRKILAPFTEEWDKKEFWKPIVLDAFLLAGIYFTSSLEFSKNDPNEIRGKQIKMNTNPRYLFQMLKESPAVY